MEKKITAPWVKGLIIALILIVFSIVIYVSGQTTNRSLGYIQFIILIGGLVWSCISYSKENDANVTFGNVFGHGFKTTAAATVIFIIYLVLAIKLIFPDMIDLFIENARTEMEKQGKLNAEQIEQGISMTRRFFMVFTIGGTIIMNAIVGALGSLLGAAIAKKNPQPNPF
jgi:hypothetical protein